MSKKITAFFSKKDHKIAMDFDGFFGQDCEILCDKILFHLKEAGISTEITFEQAKEGDKEENVQKNQRIRE